VSDVEIDFVRLCTGDNVCILVDLSRVDYISSIAIPLLINSAKSLARQGGKMALLKPQKAVENVLDLTGIPLIIPIYENMQAAVSDLRK
jgi:anti-anti-sigma factor